MRLPLAGLAFAVLLTAAAVAWARPSQSPEQAPAREPDATPAPLVTPPPAEPQPTPAEPEPAPPEPQPLEPEGAGAADEEAIAWRRSQALGLHYSGRLRFGVQLPPSGETYVTWDPILKRVPDRPWRRWGTDQLVDTLLSVLREFHADHPEASRLVVGDLSRPQGGEFGRRFGGLGHASHQNGLDVDVYYPRLDGLERAPRAPGQVDLELAQDLLDRFLDAGAAKVFVGPRVRLRGPRRRVVALVHHDDHMHVRMPNHRRRP